MAMKASKAACDLIKRFEGYSERAYKCPAGVWTIGYGHTTGVKPGDVINEKRAETLLMVDLAKVNDTINGLVKVPLLQEQFDALASFIFNVGGGAFKSSSLLRLLNEGKHEEVPAQLARWNKVGKKPVRGLTLRRQAEADMWISGNDLGGRNPLSMPQAVDAPGKPLAMSRTMIGSLTSVAGTGTVLVGDAATGVSGFITENQEHFTVLGMNVQTLLTIAAVAAIIGSIVAVYARWDDARRGRM